MGGQRLSLCFKLKWETFAGHCFGCGEWGHFMAECQRQCPSNIEVPNEENGKEGYGRGVCVSDIVVGMDVGTSCRAGAKEGSLQGLALRIRQLNSWIWKNKVWWL